MKPEITIEQFEKMSPQICSKDTAYWPEKWTPDNPFKDHCAIITLLANNLFGGQIMRAKMEDGDSHYWNKLPDGIEKDFTKSQFGNTYPKLINPAVCERSYILSQKFSGTIRRYKLLALRLAKASNPNNALFDDLFYNLCFYDALDSPCQKMKFGAVVVYTGAYLRGLMYEFVYTGCNKTIEPLRSLCEPTCIRFNIPSRTESMIGACGHAEEMALWGAIKKCVPLDECEMYVAGVYSNGLPYVKNELEFTCLRCAVQIYYSEIKKVWVPVVDRWEALTGEECVKTARAYATKEKVIS
jgi:deoxycytidylate deaminase